MMTNNDPIARCALFVAFEGMGLLDLTGPLTVFWSASKFMEQQGRHGYARHTVSLDGGPILTAKGGDDRDGAPATSGRPKSMMISFGSCCKRSSAILPLGASRTS
jgi:hypothetical protein